MTEPRVALRVDASRAIGMGHLVRTRDLGRELARRGVDHLFACLADSRAILRAQGIAADRIVEADRGGAWVRSVDPSHIVTDIMWSGNAFAAARETADLAATGRPVTVIDSMPPDHFVTAEGAVPPACVITPYLGARALRPAPRAGDWAAGAEFAVMDDSYGAARARIAPPLPARVLVSCGGSDPTGLSVRIAERLVQTGIGIDLVQGPLYPPDTRAALVRLAADHPTLTLHDARAGLAERIEAAGLVVGRIGLLRYQAAMLGRTGIYLFEGSAYRGYLENFARSGLAEVFFADPPGGDAAFLDRLGALGDPGERARLFQLNRAALDAVHGKGAANVIDRVLSQGRTE